MSRLYPNNATCTPDLLASVVQLDSLHLREMQGARTHAIRAHTRALKQLRMRPFAACLTESFLDHLAGRSVGQSADSFMAFVRVTKTGRLAG